MTEMEHCWLLSHFSVALVVMQKLVQAARVAYFFEKNTVKLYGIGSIDSSVDILSITFRVLRVTLRCIPLRPTELPAIFSSSVGG
jgi:hypothetical protein